MPAPFVFLRRLIAVGYVIAGILIAISLTSPANADQPRVHPGSGNDLLALRLTEKGRLD